mmetsp:Transcript_4702/g.15615  ORF Transcript_4702/g.15615 Transcript_4702/m.15615 type:complete len:106 (-) Transcript_4702:366-683(-)
MALRHHPDKNAGTAEEVAKAESMFKEVGDAYAILSDPDKRRRYDEGADLEEELDGGGHSHSHMDPEMFNMFQSFMGGGMPGGVPRGGRRGRGGPRYPYGGYDYDF